MGIKLSVTVPTTELLTKLKDNLEEHKKIYAEAVDGFKKHARGKLENVLELCDGRQDVYIHIDAPKDYSEVYVSAIGMLEMHKDETIELDADTYRHLAEDKWDWMENFLTSNSRYSRTAATKLMR